MTWLDLRMAQHRRKVDIDLLCRKGDQRIAETVGYVSDIFYTGAILVPELVAHRCDTIGRSIQHVHSTDVIRPVDVFVRDPDRQVDKAIVVKVTRCQRITEQVICFGTIQHTAATLVPEIIPCPAAENKTSGGAGQDLDSSSIH